MTIEKKIKVAVAWVEGLEGSKDAKELRNDAANIFADSYEEYQAIWEALRKG